MIQTCDVSICRAMYLGLSPILYPCTLHYPPQAAPLSLFSLPYFNAFDFLTHSLTIIGTKLKDEYHSDANEYVSLHFQWALE